MSFICSRPQHLMQLVQRKDNTSTTLSHDPQSNKRTTDGLFLMFLMLPNSAERPAN